MNTLNGYSKSTLTDKYVLSAAGGHLAVGNASGNIPLSNGTLNTNLNADLLDGLHSSSFATINTRMSIDDAINELGYAYPDNNNISIAGPTMVVGGLLGTYKMVLHGRKNKLWFKTYENSVALDWKTIAFTDSDITGNAASADKLKNTVKIWGLNFDGTADVNGVLTFTQTSGSAISFARGERIDSYGNLYLSNDNTSNYNIYNNSGTSIFSVLASGNVGIGTTSPSRKLDVIGYVGCTDSYIITASDAYNSLYARGFVWNYNGSSIAGTYLLASQGTATRISMSIGEYSSNKCVTVYNNGNVGIGTVIPKAKLAISIGALSANPELGSLATSNTVSIGSVGNYGTYLWTRGTGNGYIQVGREDSNTTTYNLILQCLGGNVGIGTEDPRYKLHVAGAIRSDGSILGLTTDNDYRMVLLGNPDARYLKLHTASGITGVDGRMAALALYDGSTHYGTIGVTTTGPVWIYSNTRFELLHSGNYPEMNRKQVSIKTIGWYRIAKLNSYGSYRLSISGSWHDVKSTAASFIINKTHGSINISQLGKASVIGLISAVRIVNGDTASVKYIEVYKPNTHTGVLPFTYSIVPLLSYSLSSSSFGVEVMDATLISDTVEVNKEISIYTDSDVYNSNNVGNGSCTIHPQYGNEINFGGTGDNTSIFFGYRSINNRPLPTRYVFGNGTASVLALSFIGNLTGTADVATKLGTTTVGNTYAPIYLNAGTATEGVSYAKAIKGITRSGNTFTYTCIDGTTGTFTLKDNNTYPSAYCDTAAATAAKTAYCTGYTLTSKSYIHVLIVNANSAKSAITLNINGTGAKPIYINGSASSASNYTLPAGTYIVYYNGTNFYFRTDGIIQGTILNSVYTERLLSLDTRDENITPTTYNYGFRAFFKRNGTNNMSDGGSYYGLIHFKPYGSSTDTSGGYPHLLAFTGNSNIWYRKASSSTDWGAWKLLAFTSSNVASATKLQTARTLWGLSFNGTADVTGPLNYATALSSNLTGDNWFDGTNYHPWYGYDMRYPNTGIYSTTISDYYGIYIRTENAQLILTRNGYIGVGGMPTHIFLTTVNKSDGISWAICAKNAYNAEATGYGIGIKLASGAASEDNKYWGIASLATSYYANLRALVFYNHTTEHLRITYDGKVGIGTSNPTNTLHVNGNLKGLYMHFYGIDGSTNIGYVGRGSNADNTIHFSGFTGSPIHIFSNSILNNCIYLNTSGNVGIGTTSPSLKLNVIGNIVASGSAVNTTVGASVTYNNTTKGYNLGVYNDLTFAYLLGSLPLLIGVSDTWVAYWNITGLRPMANSTYFLGTTGYKWKGVYADTFYGNATDSDKVDGYHLQSFGHYNSSAHVSNTSGSTWYIKIVLGINWNSDIHYVYCKPGYNNTFGWFILEIPTHEISSGYIAKVSSYNNCNINGFYYTRESERITVWLRCVGNSAGACDIYSTAGISSATATTTKPSGTFLGCNGLQIITNYSYIAAHYYEHSDLRLKENILNITNSDNIPQLKQFNWKSDGKLSYGLIAQELEEMGYSELVEGNDKDLKTVNYSAALSLIVGKLQVKIKELEKEIENLKNKN